MGEQITPVAVRSLVSAYGGTDHTRGCTVSAYWGTDLTRGCTALSFGSKTRVHSVENLVNLPFVQYSGTDSTCGCTLYGTNPTCGCPCPASSLQVM